MDLYQLRGFYEIARERNFTRAAEKLFLTQPAISLQLKALEEELGERLLERSRKQMRLTPAGEILFGHARQIFAHMEEARAEIAALRKVLRGRLAIATSDTNCTYVLPNVLEEFRREYSRVELEVRNRMSSEVGQLVLADEVDFGLATLPVRHRDLVSEKLFQRRDVLVCRPDHALGRRRRVRLEEVAKHPLLALERGSTSRQLLDEAFRQAGLSPQVAMDLGAVEVIKRFAGAGLGVGLVPQVAVVEDVRAGRLHAVPVQGLPPRWIGLVEHRGRRRSRAAQVFVETMQAQLAGKVL